MKEKLTRKLRAAKVRAGRLGGRATARKLRKLRPSERASFGRPGGLRTLELHPKQYSEMGRRTHELHPEQSRALGLKWGPKGGRRSAALHPDHIRQLGLGRTGVRRVYELYPDVGLHGIGHHYRWHVYRNRVNPRCPLCRAEGAESRR